MKKHDTSDATCMIIAYAGDSKSSSLEAIEAAKSGNHENAEALLSKAEESLLLAHKIHSEMITREARGEFSEINMLFIHASNLFSMAEISRAFAEQFVQLYKEMKKE